MNKNQIAVLETNELRSILVSVVNEQLMEFKKGIVKLIEKNTFSDEYLTRKSAAEFLKISETTLWSLDKTQKLPAKRLNGKVLYLKSELLTFLNTVA
jgi:hypothetical protein